MVNFRLRDLQHFQKASQCRTLSQAAQMLGITQPALTESIKRLELDLGVIVFHRSRAGIRLTAEGQLVLKKAQVTLDAVADLGSSVRSIDVFAGRRLVIGCHSTVGQYTLPKILHEVQRLAPTFEVSIVHGLSRDIQYRTQNGEVDLGLVINPIEVPNMHIRYLASDTVGIWSRKSKFDQSCIVLNPALLQTQDILRRWKNKPKRVIQAESLELVGLLVAEGIGYGILPGRVSKLLDKELIAHNQLPRFHDRLAMVYRPESRDSPAISLLRETINKHFS